MKYTLMHKTVPVLLMEIDEGTGSIITLCEMYKLEHLPVGVAHLDGSVDRTKLNKWWTGRCIPASRSGLRDALEALDIISPVELLTKCYGLSLSDQYWICPENSGLSWKDINFFENPFSEDVGNILFGNALDKDEISLISPDNTSDGWLKKKWLIINGKRCLIKGGSNPAHQEPYNEVLASAICRRLQIPHIPYTLMMIDGYPYSVCEDFITTDTELVTAWHIIQAHKRPNHISNYRHSLNCYEKAGIPGAQDALDRMLTLDYLIANEDRHYSNFGAVRNAETLEWVNPAPIYDCGTSMWYNQFTERIHFAFKHPSKPFRSDHAEQIKLVSSFEWLDLDALKDVDEELGEILKDSDFIDSARRDALCNGLRRRVELLRESV